MKIGELAENTGAPTKTIRYYESIGLLPEPERAANGYRDYDDDAIDQLRFIRDAQATGLTLNEIASVLDLKSRGKTTCGHVVDLLARHLEDLDRHIETLNRTRDRLAAMTKRAKRLDPASCSDPLRCQTIETAALTVPPLGKRNLHAPPRRHSHH